MGDAPLEGRQHEVGQQQHRFFFPHHLHDIHVLPPGLVSQGLVARRAQLHADGVRLFGGNGASHQLGAFPGDMGRADEQDLFAVVFQPRDGGVVDAVSGFLVHVVVAWRQAGGFGSPGAGPLWVCRPPRACDQTQLPENSP